MFNKKILTILIIPMIMSGCSGAMTKAYKTENSCHGVYSKGMDLYLSGKYSEAKKYFEYTPECEKKYNDSGASELSLMRLAEMYYHGRGVKKDTQKALAYADKSAHKLNFSTSEFNSLPDFFNTYWSALKGYTNILAGTYMELLQKADSSADAQYKLSALAYANTECPFTQELCPDNRQQATALLEKAAEQNYLNSAELLFYIKNMNTSDGATLYKMAELHKLHNDIPGYEDKIIAAYTAGYEPAAAEYSELSMKRQAEATEKARIAKAEADRKAREADYEKLKTADDAFMNQDYQTAFKIYKEIAENTGLPEAENKTAFFYYTALKNVVKGDKALALEWYRKAAVQGHVPSMYELGLMYEFGKGTKANDATAFSWYKKAAEGGDSNAIFKVGISYKYGDGTSKNPAKALEYLKLSAQEKTLYLPAMQELVNLCYVEKDFAQARSYQSQKESAEAMGSMADQETLVRWYKKLADRGNKAAAFMIEFQDITGSDTEQRERREKCLETAWKNGLLWPSYLYAKEIIDSHDRSIKAAAETAADLANGPFQKTESEIKRQTREAVENAENEYREKMKKAVQMLTKNAEYGDPVAQRELAQVYREYAPLKNNAKAFTWYKKAAENNDEPAIRSLAVMYEKGIGTAKNAEAAARCYDKVGEYEKAESLR